MAATLSLYPVSSQTLIATGLVSLGVGNILVGSQIRELTAKKIVCLVGGCIAAFGAEVYALSKDNSTRLLCSSVSLASIGVSLWAGGHPHYDLHSLEGYIELALLTGGVSGLADVIDKCIIHA